MLNGLKNNWCNDVSNTKLHRHSTCVATWKWSFPLILMQLKAILN